MADIFISYSKAHRPLTEDLAADLQAMGFTVWWDTALVSGDKFRHVVLAELAAARAAIVIWTPDSVKSDWVISEATRARARGILIPVRDAQLDAESIPPPFEALHTELVSNRTAILAALAKLGIAHPVGTKDTALQIELNALDRVEGAPGCRITFLISNKSGPTLDSLKVDLALFDTDHRIKERMATELGPVRAMGTIIRTYIARNAQFGDISSILLNDVMECSPGDPNAIIDSLALLSGVDGVRFYK